MFRASCKFLLIGAVMVMTLTLTTAKADAWWGGHGWGGWGGCGGWSGCYTPCYTACCTVSCDPCCGTGWYGGWCGRPYRCGWWGSSCGWSSCCYDPCYTTASCCGDTGVPVTPGPTRAAPAAVPAAPPANPPTPATSSKESTGPATGGGAPGGAAPSGVGTPPSLLTEPAAPVTPPARKEPPLGDGSSLMPGPTADNSGLLTIWVPYDAKVTVNGLPTRSMGTRRQFVSYGLQPGFSYKYEVRATIVRDNQPVEDVRTVFLTAGQRGAVAFGFNVKAGESLAGNP